MELRTVRYFVTIADAGSVSAASRQLHISQPSLSRQIHQLERELDLELFTLREGRLVLSPAGQQFVPAARALLGRAEALKAAAATIRAGSLQSVTLAAPPVTLDDVVAPFIATFTMDDPTPRVFEVDPADEYSALERGADLVIGTRPPPATLGHLMVAELPVLAQAVGFPRTGTTRRLRLRDLVSHPLLVPARDNHARRALDAVLERQSLSPTSWTEVASPRVAQALAAAGRGVAVVTDDPRFSLRTMQIETPSGPVKITLHAAWHPSHHAAQQLQALAARLRDFVTRRYPGQR